MISWKTHSGFAPLALLLICLGCASTQRRAVGTRISTPNEAEVPPRNALAELAGNNFDALWSISRFRLGSDRPAFNMGDKVKAKTSPDGPTMTVQHVSPLVYFSGQYTPDASVFTINYRCRWENKDGSESVGVFREEELEPARGVDPG